MVVKLDEGHVNDRVNQLLAEVRQTWADLREVSRNPDYSTKDLAVVGDAALKNMRIALESAETTTSVSFQTAQSNIEAALSATTINPYVQRELRDYMRSKGHGEITALVRADPMWAKAALATPAELVGMSKDQFATLRAFAEETHAPEAYSMRKNAEKAASFLADVRAKLEAEVTPHVKRWTAPEPEAAQRLKRNFQT